MTSASEARHNHSSATAREEMSSFSEHASSATEYDPNHARVLVVGPMLSGKTTLVRSLCYDRGDDLPSRRQGNRRRPSPTVGCNVDVKLLSGGRGYRSVEFWDVGGNPETALARRIFYEDFSATGVLLVYDVSNPRSLRELRTWAAELASAGIRALGGRAGTGAMSTNVPTARRAHQQHGLRLFAGGSGDDAAGVDEEEDDLEGGLRAVGDAAPLFLVVANKRDVGDEFRGDGEAFAAELGVPHVIVSAREWGRESEEPFDRFFEAIFRHRAGCNGRGPPSQDSPWNFPDDSNSNHYVAATAATAANTPAGGEGW